MREIASVATVRTQPAIAALILISTALFAQEPSPALVVKQGDEYQEMRLTRLDVDVRIHGFIAETTSTMTFFNPHDRVLEGDMVFPLPQGATINGYALDIEGKMIDGVAVEKDRARVVFEKIVRQGIDPGLMEWTRGNNFKTRIFPIPARGSRTIRVRYITEIQGGLGAPARYRLPLNFKAPVAQFDLRVEVIRPEKAPTVESGMPEGFEFKEWRSSYVAEAHGKDKALTEDLIIALPSTEREKVLVEKSNDDQYYFCIHDFPKIPAVKRASESLESLTIYWDASGSRSGQDHKREVELLDKCLAHWSSAAKGPVKVAVVLLRNVPEKALDITVRSGEWERSDERKKLLAYLSDVSYDGGTSLGGLLQADDKGLPERALLFTDGLATIGETDLRPACPLYVFCDSSTADHAFMAGLAEGSGGKYFDLKKLSDENVLDNLDLDGMAYRGAGAVGGGASDICPDRVHPVMGRQTVAGRLTADQSEIVITYVFGGMQTTQRVKVSRADAEEGELLRRFWAQTRLNDLLAFQKQNREAILALGKAHSLVTPFTSLLVLDSLDQYVEHRVMPPKSLPDLRRQYGERMEQIAQDKKKTREDKLAKVLPKWEGFCKWWGTEFKYPKNFKYAAEKSKHAGSPRANMAAAPAASSARNRGMAPPARPEATVAPASAANADHALVADEALEEAVVEAERKSDSGGDGNRVQPGIVLEPWDPETPYLGALKKAKGDKAYARYLELRNDYAASPAFFLDCANFFNTKGESKVALQVLSNIAELELENPELLRVLAHRLQQIGELSLAIQVFEQVLEMRPEEPQSYRDLALALIARAETADKKAAAPDYERAISLMTEVVMRHWERFEEIEIIALVEINRVIPVARSLGVTEIPLDKRLIKEIDCDMRITMTWDADNTDIDLHVVEPSGEEAFYSHNRTTIGGRVSRDFTQGYGPEEYMLRRAMTGQYTVKAKYYGSRSVKLLGGVTVQVNIFTHYGRPEQKCKSITVRLVEQKDMITIGQIEF